MKDTPTPRTDAKYESICESWEHQISDLPKMTEFARQLERELTAVTEQRDSIDSMYHKVIKEVLECDPIPACKREDAQLESPWEVIARVREQRDRLAEALERILDYQGRFAEEEPESIAREALKSLIPNK